MYLLILPILYLFLIIFIQIGISKNRKLERYFYKNPVPGVNNKISLTVIIPFHNEENNLPATFDSIVSQKLKNNLFEVIWINDRSTDGSEKFILAKIKNYKNHKYIKIDVLPPLKKGKRNALQIGIERGLGDYLVFTDADCILPDNWLDIIYLSFANPSIKIYAGPVTKESTGWLGKMLNWEQAFSHRLCECFMGFQKPLLVFGANWSVKGEEFYNVGGFEGADGSLSGDDDLLVQKLSKNKIQGIWKSDCLVTTKGAENWKSWWRQKRRHISAGFNYNTNGKIFYGLLHLLNLSFLIGLFVFPIGTIAFFLKVTIDIVWIGSKQKSIIGSLKLIEAIFFQLYYIVSNWLIGLISFFIPAKYW